jgi:hypothetical protein
MKISNKIIIQHGNVELELFFSKWGIVGHEFPMLFRTSEAKMGKAIVFFNLSLSTAPTLPLI